MDIRRLGYGIALPHALLEFAAPCYLTDMQWDALGKDWLEQALAYVGKPCRGSRGPLTRIRRRPGQPGLEQPQYRLADYLEQIGRRRRHREIIPVQLWQTLVDHARNSTDAARIGKAAADRMLYCYALPLLRIANDGDENTQLQADRLAENGDLEGAVAVLRELADARRTDACGCRIGHPYEVRLGQIRGSVRGAGRGVAGQGRMVMRP